MTLVKEVVLFVSRDHGLHLLNDIIMSKNYRIISVYTHALQPKSESPYNKLRHDFYAFQGVCYNESIPLFQVDSPDEKLDIPQCDFIVETSWRYLIPREILRKARVASFGLHRGKLPDYKGERPIKQALEHSDKEIIISAHDLNSSGFDTGQVFATEKYKITRRDEVFIRDEIGELFPKLALRVMKKYS